MRNWVAGSLAFLFLGILVAMAIAWRPDGKPPGLPSEAERPDGVARSGDGGSSAERPSRKFSPPPPAGTAGSVQPAKTEGGAEVANGAPAAAESPPALPAPPPPDPGAIERRTNLARSALTYVGADADAEEVWVAAIYDPTLSEHTRQDLIEDLNEEGFPDPRHPTAQDLPLIVRRLEIIEELAPFAMDEVNSAAFAEAHKDLVNMYVRLSRQ